MERNVVVVGGTNMDICGKSDKPVVAHDSNPGSVWFSTGGVGHNIALNMARMGLSVSFLTAVGDDSQGRDILCEARENGIKMVLPPFQGHGTGVYVYLCGNDGNMELAVNDMAVTSLITPKTLEPYEALLREADLVVGEANLQEETLRYIGGIVRHFVVDPVSSIKMPRLSTVWKNIEVFKPNLFELEELAGIHVKDETSLRAACRIVRALGVDTVVVSMGKDGAWYDDESLKFHMPVAESSRIVDTTGCGDAFVAGFCFGRLDEGTQPLCGAFGSPKRYALACALSASAITAESKETASSRMSREEMISRVTGMLAHGKEKHE